MNRKLLVDTAMYLVAFVAITFFTNLAAMFVCQTHSMTPTVLAASSAAGSILTIALFAWRKWSPVSGTYINTRPWFTLFWVVCLAIGSGIPMQFALEEVGVELPASYVQLFKDIMGSQLGYVSLGLLGPVAEEFVFRGAILRRLLDSTDKRWHWPAVALTAALFATVHGNWAQGINAFALGLLLGWMYMRTRSLVPGVAFHIANNTISYITCRMLPDSADKTLVEIYGGDMTHVWLAVAFSLMIFAAALYQLNVRMSHKQ